MPERNASNVIRAWWPLAAAMALFASVWGVVAYIGFARTGGHLTYALDDAYIHMALAKNLAEHGVWGATRFEFSSSSSSPLWTLLLAGAFKLFGVRDFLPLLMTTGAFAALIVVADRALHRFGTSALVRFIALAWIVIATPAAPIVFGGMEHPLQLLIDLALVTTAVRMLVSDSWSWRREGAAVLVLSAMASSVRYEGAVLVGVVALAFIARKQWRLAFAMLLAGAAPVVAYGLVSMANGAHFLPNSVLVKAATQTNAGLLLANPPLFAAEFKRKLTTAYPVYALVVASGLLVLVQRATRRRLWTVPVVFALISLGVSVIHLVVGDVGWFFRYEDYMVMLLGVAIILQVNDVFVPRVVWRPVWLATAVLVVAVVGATFVICIHRGDVGLRSTPWALKNIYDQQYQLAHFLKANPQYSSVAIGDLGAISYFNDDLRVLDLEGLALNGVPTEALGKDNLHPPLIRQLVKRNGAQIAIVFPDYFDQPAEWLEVARWTIERDVVTFGPTVAFYAIPPTDPVALKSALRTYQQSTLPADVSVQYAP